MRLPLGSRRLVIRVLNCNGLADGGSLAFFHPLSHTLALVVIEPPVKRCLPLIITVLVQLKVHCRHVRGDRIVVWMILRLFS